MNKQASRSWNQGSTAAQCEMLCCFKPSFEQLLLTCGCRMTYAVIVGDTSVGHNVLSTYYPQHVNVTHCFTS